MEYQPKRSNLRWLKDAPAYVLACYDSGPRTNDRYTVLFGKPLWEPKMGRTVAYLGMNGQPTHPSYGVSQWGELNAGQRRGLGQKVAWTNLPVEIREHVKARVEA